MRKTLLLFALSVVLTSFAGVKTPHKELVKVELVAANHYAVVDYTPAIKTNTIENQFANLLTVTGTYADVSSALHEARPDIGVKPGYFRRYNFDRDLKSTDEPYNKASRNIRSKRYSLATNDKNIIASDQDVGWRNKREMFNDSHALFICYLI